jgi:hypothetical protein
MSIPSAQFPEHSTKPICCTADAHNREFRWGEWLPGIGVAVGFLIVWAVEAESCNIPVSAIER